MLDDADAGFLYARFAMFYAPLYRKREGMCSPPFHYACVSSVVCSSVGAVSCGASSDGMLIPVVIVFSSYAFNASYVSWLIAFVQSISLYREIT
jgi:hypothetical protein